MNKYLLDTHIFLWSLLSPSNLSDKVAHELDREENELWISPVTPWETLILAEKGRIQLMISAADWLNDVLSTLPFHEAKLNHEVAIQSRKIDLPHQDPADRFIAASAMVYGLTLITADQYLIDSASDYSVFPNT